MTKGTIQTEYEFTLPVGFKDKEGTLHRKVTMRLATAGDEILSRRDPKVQQSEDYLPIVLLARVVDQIGSFKGEAVTTGMIEGLFLADYEFLQNKYNEINLGPGASPGEG